MSDDRFYGGVTIRRRYRDRQPHGWWLLPEGPLAEHPDRAWVRTTADARAEIDRHLAGEGCLMREGDRWLGVTAEERRAADSMFDLTMLRGYSAWCAARAAGPHEPCGTASCACPCHHPPA